ncbi:MAG TPA: MarC family protein [Thermoanaerobaculia bacterium]|nr:MarC family protein [Thermoanaerobaculia bacterium]
MRPLSEITLLSFTALMTMVNPLAVVPSFVAMTAPLKRSARARVALIAGIATTTVLTIFLLAGNYVFQFFGITVPAFQIMGGTIFFANSLRTLMEDERRLVNTGGEHRLEDPYVAVAESRPDFDPTAIAVVPLAIPLLSGPGAITSVMVLVNLYPRMEQKLAVLVAILAVGAASYLTLMAAMPLSRMVGDRGRAVFEKIMALLLGAIGVQFIINGLKPVIGDLLQR